MEKGSNVINPYHNFLTQIELKVKQMTISVLHEQQSRFVSTRCRFLYQHTKDTSKDLRNQFRHRRKFVFLQRQFNMLHAYTCTVVTIYLTLVNIIPS